MCSLITLLSPSLLQQSVAFSKLHLAKTSVVLPLRHLRTVITYDAERSMNSSENTVDPKRIPE